MRNLLPAAHFFVASACAALALSIAVPARADRLVAKGTTLSGKVKSITGKGVEFEPDFAKGAMLVPWDNVEDVSTEATYQVLYGDDQEVNAPVRGYRDGRLDVGDVSVDPKEIVAADALADGAPGFQDRVRSQMRYWHGNFDIAFNMQQATTDNLGFLIALGALRAHDRTRLMLGADYRYATQNESGVPERRNNDAASGRLRGEYDLSKSVFLYASTDALYDAIQNLSLRAVPKAGAGYVVWQREPKEGVRDFLAIEVGGGWVYEKYIDNGTPPDPVLDENDYFTVAFGAAAAVVLPRGMTLDWRFDYLPSVSDFAGDYVVRSVLGLNIPLIAPLSARLSIGDTYDSTPASGTDKNSLNVDTGLSLTW
jgi:hypothetical protein